MKMTVGTSMRAGTALSAAALAFAGKEVDFVREATVRQGYDCPETRRGRVPGRECEKGRKD